MVTMSVGCRDGRKVGSSEFCILFGAVVGTSIGLLLAVTMGAAL